MNLNDRAIFDIKAITTNAKEFGRLHSLYAPDGQVANVYGIHTKHNQKEDRDTGMIVNAKNATSSISEAVILEANPIYPVRNDNGEVFMVGHKINVADSTGGIKNYVVEQNIPDETVGLITLVLGDYKSQ